MHLLQKEYSPAALALFRSSRHQMKLAALREGRIEAQVWADGPQPSVAAVLYCNKLLIASSLPVPELAETLRPFLLEHIYERHMDCDAEEVLIFWDGQSVCDAVLTALEGKYPAFALREYYELDGPDACKPLLPPEGYTVVPVDAALLAMGYDRTDALREEMCSERPDVETFLSNSFGVAVLEGNLLAGWCLSEYNTCDGCEIGIEVADGHRRRGLAHAMVSAFCREAARRGVKRVGWHCFKANVPSAATALSAGFLKVLEYGELFCFVEPVVQYAVNGNFCDSDGRFDEAVTWYEKAVAAQDAPLWAYVRLAMALVSLGRADAAFAPLSAALSKGFNNWGWLNAEPRLEPLREDDRWKQFI